MPKIIENLQEQLMEEARHQVEKNGYGAVTIRSIAAACGVGTGTVYNYFSSKEELTASFMLKDWQTCLGSMREAADRADAPLDALRTVYDHLRSYMDRNASIFGDADAAASFAGSFGKYHALLRSQIAMPLRRFCTDDFAAEFIAESLLVWTANGKCFEEIAPFILKLI